MHGPSDVNARESHPQEQTGEFAASASGDPLSPTSHQSSEVPTSPVAVLPPPVRCPQSRSPGCTRIEAYVEQRLVDSILQTVRLPQFSERIPIYRTIIHLRGKIGVWIILIRNAGSTKSAFAPRKHVRSRSERRLSPEVILPAFLTCLRLHFAGLLRLARRRFRSLFCYPLSMPWSQPRHDRLFALHRALAIFP